MFGDDLWDFDPLFTIKNGLGPDVGIGLDRFGTGHITRMVSKVLCLLLAFLARTGRSQAGHRQLHFKPLTVSET
jgi:hypothetical protein